MAFGQPGHSFSCLQRISIVKLHSSQSLEFEKKNKIVNTVLKDITEYNKPLFNPRQIFPKIPTTVSILRIQSN